MQRERRSPAPDLERLRAFRLERSRSEASAAARWNGIAIAIMSLANQLAGDVSLGLFARHLLVAAVLLYFSYAFAKRLIPTSWVPWAAGFCALVVTGEFQLEVWQAPDAVGLAYVLLIMLTAGPMILDPVVFMVVATLSLGGCIAVSDQALMSLTPSRLSDWVLVAITAELIGAILMGMRLRAIDELGATQQLIQVVAAHDALTGLLNRHGMQSAVGALTASAAERGEVVQATFVDIDWLKTANDVHGHEFGDQVIQAVAKAVEASFPDGSLLARWGGDEFLVIGIGAVSDDARLEEQLREHIANSDIDLNKWPGEVSVGSASGTVTSTSLEALIKLADERMYARRRAKRSVQ